MEKGEKPSLIGWNWGDYTLEENNFRFDVKGAKCFSLPYAGISLASATSNNEVTVEMNLDNVEDE